MLLIFIAFSVFHIGEIEGWWFFIAIRNVYDGDGIKAKAQHFIQELISKQNIIEL
jgi:hypothetical protein